MRASDTDRQRAIDELRRHCAAGRLDIEEFASRIDAVHSALTTEDLEAIRADLPIMRVADPAGAGGVRAAGPTPPAVWSKRGVGAAAGHRAAAVVVAAVSVLVVLAAVAMVAAAEWVWAVMLVAGWLLGMLQGRASNRRRDSPP